VSGWYERTILPHVVAWVMDNKRTATLRPRVLQGLSGEVLELGFGAGLNLPHYPAGVTRVRAVDPDLTGRELAAERIDASPVQVDFVGLDGARLDVPDASVDHVAATWTLCTIPDVESALSEVVRVLKPGGTFSFIDHARHPESPVAAWQDRLTPLWKPLAGGCHLNRDIAALVQASGLSVDVEAWQEKGPKLATWTVMGRGTKAG
jgi:ubiquinone/menaquinone biosynthesis C-methylase UbiE